MDIVSLIGCLSIGINENLWHQTFTPNWWEKILLRWLISKRSLATALGYAQRNAYDKYNSQTVGQGG